jgi:hypothetical protein
MDNTIADGFESRLKIKSQSLCSTEKNLENPNQILRKSGH